MTGVADQEDGSSGRYPQTAASRIDFFQRPGGRLTAFWWVSLQFHDIELTSLFAYPSNSLIWAASSGFFSPSSFLALESMKASLHPKLTSLLTIHIDLFLKGQWGAEFVVLLLFLPLNCFLYCNKMSARAWMFKMLDMTLWQRIKSFQEVFRSV